MFNPSRDEVRKFFFEAWAKHLARSPLLGLEVVAVDVMLTHPEYRELLVNPDKVAARDYVVEAGKTNPFLHMSLHLAIEEQLSIDQPAGLRAEVERLARKLGDRHDALHAVLECLGEALWRSQREGGAPDSEAYLECVRKR